MLINLSSLLINVVISTIIGAPALWLAGRLIVGGNKAKFTDAMWITALGVIIGTFTGLFFTGIAALIAQFIVWLLLVKHFFDASFGQALIIAVANVIIWIIIGVVLAFIGFAIITWL